MKETGFCLAGDIMEEKIMILDEHEYTSLARQQIENTAVSGLVITNASKKIKGVLGVRAFYSLNTELNLAEMAKHYPFRILNKDSSLEEVIGYFREAPEGFIVVVNAGEPVGIIDAGGALKKLWERFRLNSIYLNAIMETADEAITVVDKDGKVLLWNQKAEEFYKISLNEIAGKSIKSFFHYNDVMVTKAIEENNIIRNTHREPCEGTHILTNSNPILVDNEIIGGISADRNITELVCLYQELCTVNSPVKMVAQDRHQGGKEPFRRVIGHSRQLKNAINLSRKVAATDASVLIRGETGTGKELFAEAIHYASDRRDKPLININCGAIPPSLFESELFGYEGGAFTGADRKGKPGQFELANGGTIFLDEIGELPLKMQVKLLRVLQNKIFYRIGGSKPIQVDVRIISATNRNLEDMIVQGQFRDDLFYRLNVFSIEIPPLRERREDIPQLVQFFVGEFSNQYQRSIEKIDSRVIASLLSYTWPGNIRELRNVLERMVILAENHQIEVEFLPPVLQSKNGEPKMGFFENITDQTEKDLILNALENTSYNIAQATKFLGIPRSTLYYKMRIHGIKSKRDPFSPYNL